jgi:hypothetical protein
MSRSAGGLTRNVQHVFRAGRARSAGRRGLAGMAKKLGLLRGRLEVIDA